MNLLNIKKFQRVNCTQLEISFENSLDASAFEVAFHAMVEAAEAAEEQRLETAVHDAKAVR